MNLKGVQFTKVYIDILFLCNFIMDFCLLIFFCRLTDIKSPVKRAALSAFCGAVSDCILIYLNPVMPLKIIFGNIIIPAVIIFTAFFGITVINVKLMLKYIIIWYFSAFAAGGLISCVFGDRINIYELVFSAVFIIFAGNVILRYGNLSGLRKTNNNIYSITIYKNKRFCTGFAKYDSANTLYEPISGSNVIVCACDTVKEFLTEGEKKYIELFPSLPDEWDGKTMLRSIPFSSVGEKRGCMPAVALDKVCISKGKRKMIYKGCYLAISDNGISINKDYDFLLNYKMKL